MQPHHQQPPFSQRLHQQQQLISSSCLRIFSIAVTFPPPPSPSSTVPSNSGARWVHFRFILLRIFLTVVVIEHHRAFPSLLGHCSSFSLIADCSRSRFVMLMSRFGVLLRSFSFARILWFSHISPLPFASSPLHPFFSSSFSDTMKSKTRLCFDDFGHLTKTGKGKRISAKETRNDRRQMMEMNEMILLRWEWWSKEKEWGRKQTRSIEERKYKLEFERQCSLGVYA